MSLRVWLPLVRDNLNQGLDDLQPTNLGTVSFIDGGKLGKCLSAGTSTQTANGISYPTNLVSELGTQFSCAIWVKPLGTHVHYNGTFVSSGNWNAKCWSFGVSQDNTKVDIFSKGYNRYLNCEVPVNTWTHLCCTSDNGTVKLYKNGVYVGQATGVSESLDSDATNFCVGRETYAGGYFSFNGNINDLRIYDHVLSPKEIKLLSQGLVCHYKLSDPYIEGTTNTVTSTDCLSATCYNGARRKYGYGENTDMYKTMGFFEGKYCTKVYMGTSGELANPYPYINGNAIVSDGTNAPEYKTVSFDYFGTIGTYIQPYKLGDGSATCTWTNKSASTQTGTYTNNGQIPVVPNKWNHITMVLHGTTAANAAWGYIILGAAHTSDTANYWLFANLQIEEKDHETPYAGVGGTRNEPFVLDSSGYNHHGINYSSQVLPNAPRNSNATFFDGSSQYIEFPNLSFMPTMLPDEWSFSFWVYNQDNGDRSIIFSNYQLGTAGINGFCFEKAANNNLRVGYVGGKFDRTIPNSTMTVDAWTHYVVTKTKAHLVTVYRNGIQIDSYTNTNCASEGVIYRMGRDVRSDSTMYHGGLADFRAYATVLTLEDAQELYNAPVSIANTGTMLTQGEFVEVAT